MRAPTLAWLLCLTGSCSDAPPAASVSTPGTPLAHSESSIEPAEISVQPHPAADAEVHLSADGKLRLDSVTVKDAGELRSHLDDAHRSEVTAYTLDAAHSLPWKQVRPIVAALSEAPGPGFIQVSESPETPSIELAWWTTHPGQVSNPDRGEKKTPLTLTLDLYPTRLTLGGFELESIDQAVELVQASVKTASGGVVPVLIRAEDDISWGQILELASALADLLQRDRPAVWHEPPPPVK